MERSLKEELKKKLNIASMHRPAMIGVLGVIFVVMLLGIGMLTSSPSGSRTVIEPMSTNTSLTQQNEESKPSSIFVHVSGAVEKPGLVELDVDSRVASAIEAAGGFAADANRTSVNLARVLNDGEQLYIATQSANENSNESAGSQGNQSSLENSSVAQQSSEGAVSGSAGTMNGAGKININTASASQLTTLPGIGESTANKIINDRTANGSFKRIEDLTRVSGIGEKKLETIRDLICV